MELRRESVERMMKYITEVLLPHLGKRVDVFAKLVIQELPRLEALLLEGLEIMFSPRQLIRQVVIVAAVQLIIMAGETLGNIGNSLVIFLSKAEREQQEVIKELSQAVSYKEWKKVAARLDYMRGYDKWRLQDESSLFDCSVLKKRIDDTAEMVRQGDVFRLMFRLRGGLARDQYGMQHEGLFSRAISGTKLIVEQYHESVAYALDFICDSQIVDEEIPTDAKLAFFNETRHAYGRTALLLSGGAYLGFYHIGVVKALFLEGLLPRVVSGASAGSLVAAMVGTKSDAELRLLFDTPNSSSLSLRRDYFKPKSEIHSTTGRQIQRLVPTFLRPFIDPLLGLIFDSKFINLDTEHFKKAVMDNVGEHTFQEAFDQTGRIINITVAPINNYDPPRLLNYLTAPHVCVWSAACASCAVPGLFDSITLIIKEPNGIFRPENEWTRQAHLETAGGTKSGNYTDGSIESDLPMQQISELFNVNHFVVSQVNAHSALLSSMALKATVWSSSLYGALVGFQRFLKAQCRDWLRNAVNLATYRSNKPSWSAKRGLHQMLTQDYEGREVDITITPWTKHLSLWSAFSSIIKNPGDAEYLEVIAAGEAATWPFFSRIKAHCHVEMTLDRCVQRLRQLIAIEEEEDSAAHRGNRTNARATPSKANHTSSLNWKTGKIDRTPSFYTSRSILNISGLSVSDRIPLIPIVQQVTKDKDKDKEKEVKNGANGHKSSSGAPKKSAQAAQEHSLSAPISEVSQSVSPIGSLSTSGSSGMFGGGWGLEGGGSSQEFDITTQIPESSSRSRSGSGGNTPRRTQKQPSRTETVPARDTVVQKRKPFGSPASPKVRSPKNTPQPSTSTSTSVVAETHSENDITKNNDVNKGRERGVFHASNSSDVLFKRSAQAAAGAGVSADPLKKYQKKDIIGGVGNHNDNDNGDDDDSNSNEDIQKRSIEKKNADSGEDSPSTGEHSVAENSSETKWNDEDFALSVSVRTNDIPLKGYTVQRNGNSNDENGKDNGKKIDGEIGGEGGGGVEADKKSDKGSEQEGDGIKEGEEGVGAGAGGAGGEVGGLKSLRDDSQTVHKTTNMANFYYRARSADSSPGGTNKLA